jgi:hypothetical protein
MPRVTPTPIPVFAPALSPRVVTFDTAGVMVVELLCQFVEERLAVVVNEVLPAIVTSDDGEDRAFGVVVGNGNSFAAEYEEQTGLKDQISLAVNISVPLHVASRQGSAEFQIIADSAPHWQEIS